MTSYSYARVPSTYYSSSSRRGNTIIDSYPKEEVVYTPRRSTYRSRLYADERPSSTYFPTASSSSAYPVEPITYTRSSRAPEYTTSARSTRRPSTSSTMVDEGNSYVLYGSKGTRLEVQIDTPSPRHSPASSHASSSRSNLSSHTSYDSHSSRSYRKADRDDYMSTTATIDGDEYERRSRRRTSPAVDHYSYDFPSYARDSRVDDRLRERVSRADERGRYRPFEASTSNNSSSRWSDKTVRAPTPPSPLSNPASRGRWADEDKPSITERMEEMRRRREAKKASERGTY